MNARSYVFPNDGDDLATIAARVLPDRDDGATQLMSWNLHLAARLGGNSSIGLLPSDVVFTEPPAAR